MNQTVIGLSGHIDHGKTALVKALTGKSTERYTEEVKRGMTIDIGFAFLSEEITLIDVPGHEKFVKNMMAGVSGIDAAILVIAADDGVMPQTREHLEILKLLDIKVGIIVINKIDLVDDDWLELVELDLQELVENTFLESAPIHKVSAINNIGIKELKTAILEIPPQIPQKYDRGFFRLPIDRVFSIKGFGSVVTGTVSSGEISVGETIEVLPLGETYKVRGIQSHDSSVESISLGARAAINIQSLDIKDIKRGNQIATPNYVESHDSIAVELSALSNAPSIKQNQRIRVHLGTQEVMGRVSIVDNKTIEAGESSAALIKLEQPLISTIGDRFIIRLYSPIITIGGGEIIDTGLLGKWKQIKTHVSKLYQIPKEKRIQFLISQRQGRPFTLKDAVKKNGISIGKLESLISEDNEIEIHKFKANNWLLTENQKYSLQDLIINFLESYHIKHPYKSGASKEEIRQSIKANESFCDYFLGMKFHEDKIKNDGDRWSLYSFKIELSVKEESLLNKLMDILDNEGFTSSRYDELAEILGESKDHVMQLLNIAEQKGEVLRLDGSLMFTKQNYEILISQVKKYFNLHSELSVPEFKELAGTSRKYAVPLLEYLDKQKITYRDGNSRKLVV